MKYFSLLMLLLICSCSTFASISNESGYKGQAKVYAGTRNDLSGIPCLFNSDEFGWGVLALGELPFCLVADTVLLPYTIYLDCEDKTEDTKQPNQEMREEKNSKDVNNFESTQ